MCGICGIIHMDDRPASPAELRRMLELIRHRGPDDEGSFIDRNAGLGNVRLSIIDLTPAGRQPMCSPDGRYCLVYNGEIYNYLELKEALQSKHTFQTWTDTEVVLKAFLEWGPDCLHRFNGMFALAFYDRLSRELFIARDRFGIKPFYYCSGADGSFRFASEARALLPYLRDRRPNRQAVSEYLLFNRTDQGEETFFEGVRKLPHGACGMLRQGKLEIRRWYRLADSLKEPFRDPAEFYDAFRVSVGLHLRSDVPVGVCLSGGLDSSSIVSVLLREYNLADLHTFSAVYEKGAPADESRYIDEYRPHLQHMYVTRPTAGSLEADLDRFLACQAEPVATLGPYAQFKVMELAREHVKVTLDGQGADETLAGYHYFFGSYFKQLFTRFHWGRLLGEASAYLFKYHSLYALQYFTLYLAPARIKSALGRLAHDYLERDFYRESVGCSRLTRSLYNPRDLNDSLLQHFEHKLEHLLKWEDHNSMCFSLESRVPFLDPNLVERLLSLPAEKLIRRATTKQILREAMTGVLPEPIRTRPDKVGFAVPWDQWFRSPAFQERIRAMLHSDKFRDRGFLDPRRCLRDYERHLSGRTRIAREIWKWLNLEWWFEHFIDDQGQGRT
mgnify:CR=1 FL=1